MIRLLLIICIALTQCLLLNSCSEQSAKVRTRSFHMGVIFWPPIQYNDETIKDGITHTIDNSDILTAQIPWTPRDTFFVKKAEWISSLAEKHNRKLVLNIDWLEDDRKGLRGGNWNFQDNKTKERFIRSVYEACKLYKPGYINLGVEVNFYALKDPEDFKAFVDTYNFTKSLLNKSFPDTKVSVTFQLELLFGQHVNWGNNASKEVLAAFGDNFDILAISTYPHSNRRKFSNTEFISEILKLTTKPIGIFETSVPSNSFSEQQQADYLEELLIDLKKSERFEVLIWTSTMDSRRLADNAHWVNYLGLLDYDLKPKKTFGIWQSWYALKNTN